MSRSRKTTSVTQCIVLAIIVIALGITGCGSDDLRQAYNPPAEILTVSAEQSLVTTRLVAIKVKTDRPATVEFSLKRADGTDMGGEYRKTTMENDLTYELTFFATEFVAGETFTVEVTTFDWDDFPNSGEPKEVAFTIQPR